MERYIVSYQVRQGKNLIPATLFAYAFEVSSILRNMAHLAISCGFEYSNVTFRKV